MAQLDKFLTAMMTNHASALVLADGEVVKLEIGGQLRPGTKAPLSGAQILNLLQEVASPHEQMSIDMGNPVEILRATPDGAFVIKAQMVDGKWRAVVSIGKNVPESKPARPAPAAPPAAKRTPTPAPTPVVAAPAPVVAAAPAAGPPPAPVSRHTAAAVAGATSDEDLDTIPWFE